jgi:4,5-DOPA dioxygenase extradiol
MPQAKQPILFLSHGSPMTALGGDDLSRTWSQLAGRLARPAAILMVSAHWNTRLPLVSGSAEPETIHDFGGFPAELYRIRYPARGNPALAQRIKKQLTDAGLATGIDAGRGLDHGAWVPLRILFPSADVPVLQLSVQPERCARHHHALGAALASLSRENILVIASGHMTHNLMDFMRAGEGEGIAPDSQVFRDWVHERLMAGDNESLLDWQQSAPGARHAHPTPEHFLPLFVALGAAGEQRTTEWLGGSIDGSLAADNYLFEPV